MEAFIFLVLVGLVLAYIIMPDRFKSVTSRIWSSLKALNKPSKPVKKKASKAKKS
jgi:hypothetical protein